MERLDSDEKGVTTIYTLGGSQEVAIISESGLYSLVLTSRKPQAKVFKRWLTHEVIPSIRKTGSYSVTEIHQPSERVLPKRDAVDYANAAKTVAELPQGILKQLIYDALVDQINLEQNLKYLPVAEKPKQYTIAKVRAKMLGYTDKQIGSGSALGRFVRNQINPAFQEMIGKYPVFHYEITEELDRAIASYFS